MKKKPKLTVLLLVMGGLAAVLVGTAFLIGSLIVNKVNTVENSQLQLDIALSIIFIIVGVVLFFTGLSKHNK